MIKQIPSAETHISAEEAAKIMNEMERLLGEINETMGTIKKLIAKEPPRQSIKPFEKVGSS